MKIRSLGCLLLLAWPWPLLAADDGDITALLARFAQHREFVGEFKEYKTSGLLAHTLELEGQLIYRAPAYLEKHIHKPYDERQIIDGDQVILEHAGEPRRTLSLTSVPEMKIVVDSLRATLAGDAAALRANYRVQKLAQADGWHLRLTPRDAAVEESVREIHISGNDIGIREFRIVQTAGGESRVVIAPGS